MKEQWKLFKEFVLSQQHVLFGKIDAEGETGGKLPEKWDVTTPGGYGDSGFDWSKHSRELFAAKKIRLSMMARCEVFVALAETNERKPRRINCVYGGWRN